MRHIKRLPLPEDAAGYLADRQFTVDTGADARETWAAARRAAPFGPVLEALRTMTGETQRCMFCEDSLGADVDHFWPLGGRPGYPERAFEWSNLLLTCTPCNRAKGDEFPVADDGSPLLVDPTTDEPTEHLWFIGETGELAAAWRPDGGESAKGIETLRVIHHVNAEPIARRRQRVHRILASAVYEYLAGDRGRASLLNEIREHPDFGLARWFLLDRGSDDEPFCTLATTAPDVWAEAQAAARFGP